MIRFASPGAVALAIGPMSIRWYGVLLAGAAVLGLALARRQAVRQGEDLESFVTACCLALGGGIVGVVPGQFGIGVFSPPLDAKGNSVRGVAVCRVLSERFGLHSFETAFAGTRLTQLMTPARGG